MLFYSDVPLGCINEAAYEYHIPAKLIIAVLNVEQGRVGMANRNKNGTYDLGPMQINTSWWPRFSQYGLTQEEVKNNACLNVKVGTWVLSKDIADSPGLLKGIGDYHSMQAPLNRNYLQKVRVIYTRLSCRE